jgi:copper chaperone CopZ
VTRRYKTNLRCAACVTAIGPALDSAPGVKRWSADVESPDKVLTVEGDASAEQVAALIGNAGYVILGELPAEELRPATVAPSPVEEKTSYFPLALVVAYILGTVLLVEFAAGTFVWHRAMTNFMAGFFLVFSFFKLLDLRAFADTYQTYDLVAARSRAYALAYPFIELALGVAYLTHFQPVLTNAVTLVVMLVGTAGVVRTLLARRKIRCACLGAVFNLPMSYVTLAEDGLMAAMAAVMLVV